MDRTTAAYHAAMAVADEVWDAYETDLHMGGSLTDATRTWHTAWMCAYHAAFNAGASREVAEDLAARAAACEEDAL